MKVKFKSPDGSSLRSSGKHYIDGGEYEVTATVGKYLIDTFPNKFSEVEAPKAAPKPKAKPTKKPEAPKED